MDPFDNPQMFQRSIENPADPADETETCAAQPSGKRSANEVARKLIEHMLEPKE
jgi:hypothetical protein